MKRTTFFQVVLLFVGLLTPLGHGQDVFIQQGVSGAGLTGLGTAAQPYLVPPDDASAFDTVVGGLTTGARLNVGPGLFLTTGTSGGVYYPSGSQIRGAGPTSTTLKLVNPTNAARVVVLHWATSPTNSKVNSSARDLTIDCNFTAQAPSCIKVNGINYSGFGCLIENVEIVDLGGRGEESFGVVGGNFANTGWPVTDGSNVVIRNCKIHKTSPSANFISALTPAGDNAWTGVVEGCYIDMSNTAKPGNGIQGITFAGATQHLVFRDNTVIGCGRGFHVDSPGNVAPANPKNVVVSENRFLGCLESIAVGWPDQAGFNYENFLISNNFLEQSGGTGIRLCSLCRGFRVVNNSLRFAGDTPPGAYCYMLILDTLPSNSNVIATGNDFVGNHYGPATLGIQKGFHPASYVPALGHPGTTGNRYRDNGLLLADGSIVVPSDSGEATLGANGEVIVPTTFVQTNSRILLTTQLQLPTAADAGDVKVSDRTDGVSFTIKSNVSTDRSRVAWYVVNPTPKPEQ